MKKETKQIFPIKCPHCGENSYWNKDFTLNVFWTSTSKEMKDYEKSHADFFLKDVIDDERRKNVYGNLTGMFNEPPRFSEIILVNAILGIPFALIFALITVLIR